MAVQQLSELPYAAYLQPLDEELSPEGDYVEVLIADAELDGVDISAGRLRESAVTGTTVSGARFARTQVSDVWCDRTRWIEVSAPESGWRDVTMLRSALAGIELYAAEIRRVTFQECKIDTLNLRGTALRNVRFDRCELTEVDFGGAQLTSVDFPGSALRRVRFDQARLAKVDFRGATELDLASGFDSLRNAVVSQSQLLDLAPGLAHALGIVVKEH